MARTRASLPLLAVSLGYFMVILDTTAVNTALPALRADLHADVSDLQWVVDGYTLTFAALLLSGGALADRLGARRVFSSGLGGFVVASAACGLAPSTSALVAARLVQGVTAALLVPASLALLQAAFPTPAQRARAVGVWGGIAGVAAAGGPALGGALAGGLSWRAVFFVNVPVGAVALALTARHVPAPAPRRDRGLDLRGQTAAALTLAALTVALIDAGRDDWTAAPVVAGMALAVAALAAFVTIERRTRAPVLPLRLFASRTFSAGTLIGLLINLGFYGQLFTINLLLQAGRGLSPLRAGLALVPEGIMASAGSMLSGRITSRAGGPRPTLLLGLALGGAGLLALAVAGPAAPYAVLLAPLMATGFGMALVMPAATTAVVESAPGDRAGAAAGAINASRQVGGLIGVALLGSMVSGGLDAGLRPALLVAAAAFAVGALAAAGWIGRTNARDGTDARRGTGARDASASAEACSDYR